MKLVTLKLDLPPQMITFSTTADPVFLWKPSNHKILLIVQENETKCKTVFQYPPTGSYLVQFCSQNKNICNLLVFKL